MPTENTTPNRGYELPFGSNQLTVDVSRIVAALTAIDTDIADFATALAQTSNASFLEGQPGSFYRDPANFSVAAFIKTMLQAATQEDAQQAIGVAQAIEDGFSQFPSDVQPGEFLQRNATNDGYNRVSVAALKNLVRESGEIVSWSGSIASIPSGWALCDGNNGTPDLRDRFIVGAGSAYAVGATGGADQVTLTEAQMPSHNHGGVTNTTGNHAHSINLYNEGTVSDNYVGSGGNGFTTTQWTNAAGNHAHTIPTAGSDQAHENRPPYYALALIMKL